MCAAASELRPALSIMTSKPKPASPSSILNRGASPEKTWSYLYDGIEDIMLRREQEGLSFSTYMNLYTAVYNYFISCKVHIKPNGRNKGARFSRLTRTTPSLLTRMILLAGANLGGKYLYNRLSGYFIKHFKPIIQVLLQSMQSRRVFHELFTD